MGRPRKIAEEDERVDFHKLTMAHVQQLVGRAADAMEIHNGWVVLLFAGQFCADTRVRFKQW